MIENLLRLMASQGFSRRRPQRHLAREVALDGTDETLPLTPGAQAERIRHASSRPAQRLERVVHGHGRGILHEEARLAAAAGAFPHRVAAEVGAADAARVGDERTQASQRDAVVGDAVLEARHQHLLARLQQASQGRVVGDIAQALAIHAGMASCAAQQAGQASPLPLQDIRLVIEPGGPNVRGGGHAVPRIKVAHKIVPGSRMRPPVCPAVALGQGERVTATSVGRGAAGSHPKVGAHARDPRAAYLVGAAYVAKNLATHIRDHISKCRPGDRILVYCFRGGKRSRAWVDTLRSIGFETDVIEGGWKRYRSWVRDGLTSLAPRFEYRVLSGLTGCGKTRLLHALAHAGNQVLDLEGLASHRGSLLGALPGDPQPSQKIFDIQLPAALIDAMRETVHLQLSVPIDERVRLLREDYAHLADNPMAMVQRLLPPKALVGGDELALWQSLAEDGQVDELCRRVLQYHNDPSYRRSRQRSHSESGTIIELPAMDPESLASTAADLTMRFGDCTTR